MKNEIIDEGIIPMNFNFNQHYTAVDNSLDDYSNGTGKLNDLKKRELIQQNIEKNRMYKQFSIEILNNCAKAIDGLITGNSHEGFTYNDSIILLNSIRNKCNEILNRYAVNIDNDILIEQAELFQNLYSAQYYNDVTRYDLEYSSNSVSFNTKKGIVKFNPHGLYDIVADWCMKNMAHSKSGDIQLFE